MRIYLSHLENGGQTESLPHLLRDHEDLSEQLGERRESVLLSADSTERERERESLPVGIGTGRAAEVCPAHPAKREREREAWGDMVYQSCQEAGIRQQDHIVCLAGGKYSQTLRRYFPDMETPMEGMGLGHRMHWMNEQLKG